MAAPLLRVRSAVLHVVAFLGAPPQPRLPRAGLMTGSAALPFYVQIVAPARWGYRCDACPGSWVHFATEEAAQEFAALHVKESHDGC